MLLGAGSSAVIPVADHYTVIKTLSGSFDIMYAAQAVNPELITVCRSLHTSYGMIDCPQVWNWGDPAVWFAAQRPYLPTGCDYYEIQNECGPPPQGWAYWAKWAIEIAQLVEQELGGALLAFSFAPGTPDIAEWGYLLPYFEWAAAHPLSDGRYHGIAFHAAPNMRAPTPEMVWVNNPYLTIERVFMLVGAEYVLYDWPGAVAITEWGLSGSYAGAWDVSYDCDDVVDAYQTTIEVARQVKWAGDVLLMWWNIGEISIWESDHECLEVWFK